jgi:hypothetical protein
MSNKAARGPRFLIIGFWPLALRSLPAPKESVGPVGRGRQAVSKCSTNKKIKCRMMS